MEANQAQERAARKACLSGDYAKGVSILAELFVDTRNPTFVFNQGRCFEQNRLYEDAIARFEEYLNLPDAKLSDDDRAAAEKRIADCRAKLPPRAPVVAPQPLAYTVPLTVPPAVPTPQPAPVPPTAAAVESSPASKGGRMRTAGVLVASVGVAALAAGVVLNLKANGMVNDWRTKVSYTASQNDQYNTYKTWSWVGYGAGAACVATGAVLFGIGVRQGAGSNTVALLPAVNSRQVGALVTGGF